VKAAAWLVQTGDTVKASQYIKAASDYRDRLTAAQQAQLDGLAAQVGANTGRAATAASSAPAPAPAAPAASGMALRGGGDDKQTARWMLQQARDLIGQARYDEAAVKVAQVKRMDVHWTLFDDTPARVEAALAKVRPAPAAATAVAAAPRGDRNEAKAKLKEARQALTAGQVEVAEAIAQQVATWNVSFGMLDDTPDKVLSAARALRKRDVVRNAGPTATAAQDFYAMAIQEARGALAAGKLDAAEEAARKAQQLNVVPPLTADRAEAVLHDVAMARARGTTAVAANAPAIQAESDANALLASGRQAEAAAKYAEAERLRSGQAPTDPAVMPAQAAIDTAPPPALTLQPVGSDPAPEMAPALAAAPPSLDPAPAIEMPAPAPVPAPAAAPAVVDDAPAPASSGEEMLQRATSLIAAGNFAEARLMAEKAKSGGFGVEARADEVLAQVALASQTGALQAYEAALDSLRKQDFDRARALLSEISAMEVPDEGLMQKVQDLMARIPADKPGEATLGTVTDADAVKAQKLNVEVGTKLAESRRLIETEPDKAIELLQTTLKAVQASDVSESARRLLVRRLEVAVELAKKDKVGFDEKMKDKTYKAEIEAKKLRILEADKAKKEQVAQLMTKAKEAEALGNLLEAEQLAKRASEIDPNNLAATAMATVSRLKRHYERDKDIESLKQEGAVEAFQQVSEAGIAPTDVQTRGIAFPKDFGDLTRSRREMAARLAPKKDPADMAIEAKLNESITLNMDKEQPLGEVVNYLASYTGMNVVVDPKALQEEGLTLNTPISLRAKDIKIKSALKLMLSPYNLTYTVQHGVLLITSPQANRFNMIVQAYSVADLVISPLGRSGQQGHPGPAAAFDPAKLAGGLSDPVNPAGATGNPMMPGMPVNANGSDSVISKDRPQITGEDFAPLINLIKASIAPGTWKDGTDTTIGGGGMGLGGGFGAGGDAAAAGETGGFGSITPFFLNISLIIRHTSEVHSEIEDLLRQLRKLQDLQISVEVRFITVSDSFFEEIGVDFDFAIQSDVVGKKSSFAVPNPNAVPVAPGTGTGTGGGTAAELPFLINPARDHSYGARQPLVVGMGAPTNNIANPQFSGNLMLPFVQDSFSAITPFNALTTNTGATFGLAFLSDLEVYLFLKAVQGDQRSNLVQAPKVTTFNGSFAAVTNNTSRYFVQSLTPLVGAGAVAFQPQIGLIPDGVTLFVTPVVSADRRYVRMSLSPFFLNFIEFQTFTVPAAVGGGGLGGQATGINAQLQLPVISSTIVTTTVTVPDGGTVLLGGVKRLREERKEFGVPVLSKAPLINRLFRNIGVGRTTDSLMIMVTPRIIILEEEEQKIGIPAVEESN
jgi:type II secretory pathway component GspD/PulD (secretin)